MKTLTGIHIRGDLCYNLLIGLRAIIILSTNEASDACLAT